MNSGCFAIWSALPWISYACPVSTRHGMSTTASPIRRMRTSWGWLAGV
jgi:hypothetical protein